MDLHVEIKEQTLSTRPDRYMWIKTQRTESDEATLAEFTEVCFHTPKAPSQERPLIPMQCKREKHGKKEHEIFGQELAHLLGAAERKKEKGKRLGDGEYYTVSINPLSSKYPL